MPAIRGRSCRGFCLLHSAMIHVLGGYDMLVSAYVDGFNFYEASRNKSWYPYGWCNWTKTIENYCPGAEVRVKYFTSDVSPRHRGSRARQDLHLRAMREVARAEVIKGVFRERNVMCRQCNEPMRCPKCGKDTKMTEKQTDVNISLHLFEDAIDRRFDWAFLVSADLDLVPAVEAALRRHERGQIRILFPPESGPAVEFSDLERGLRGRLRLLHLDLNRMVRFPDDLPARWGLALPKHWRERAGPRPKVIEDNSEPRTSKGQRWWES